MHPDTATAYATATGRHAAMPLPSATDRQPTTERRAPARPPLSVEEEAHCAEVRATCHRDLPEVVDLMRELRKVGIDVTWRDVTVKSLHPAGTAAAADSLGGQAA